jgi:hypothetical protein
MLCKAIALTHGLKTGKRGWRGNIHQNAGIIKIRKRDHAFKKHITVFDLQDPIYSR